MASKSTLRADAPEFSMMLCGKHVSPPNILEHSGFRLELRKERYFRPLLPGEKHGDRLCDYYGFPELLQERKQISPEVKTPKKPFPLFKLPAELRVKVYEYAVTSDEAIEFCPEPYFYSGLGPKHRRKGDWWDDFDHAKAYHKQAMKRAAGCAALLRVNKQLCSEATPVFYGENEFRFSNVTGWIGLDLFLYKIGLENHPQCLRVPTSLKQGRDFDDGSPFHRLPDANRPGFLYDTRWFDEEISIDPLLILQKAGKLQHLRLISPANTHITFDYNPFDLTCFNDLKVTVVSLRSEKLMPTMGSDITLPWSHKDAEAAKNMAEQHLEETGEKWEYFDKVIDEYGLY
ncbi:hypothetical protein M409DRAFT_53909 [Zasmidium cellare ATCC 36951]|uniref:Uncharacterized protein n=1 Tax=Zasmidium cellare ATCC 36951 TaxID=1080233 RepID=A0A6A6CLP6_ZASCE|nr:uncharacterized protein M409DRAFT_53909 [Zasmidium cellare ATCC 36951]KAF2167971.1 hypothetical protein M409DRAFT_53909 [Zasmidium cellare ATCC 36951]